MTLFHDSYHTIASPAEGVFRDRGSKFIAFAFPVKNEPAFKTIYEQVKKDHHSAAHHCWALVTGPAKEFRKSSDDREPSNSAGKPILRTILSKDLTYVAVIVVRYFGGKLLGIPGLIHAYSQATLHALEQAAIVEHTIIEKYFIATGHETAFEAFRILKQQGLKFYPGTDNGSEGIIFEVRKQQADHVLKLLRDKSYTNIRPAGQED
jgi:uncharacterized YigZ family protein